MINPKLYRPILFFLPRALQIITRDVIGYIEKVSTDPDYYYNLKNDFKGVKEDLSSIMDDLRMRYAKPVQMVDDDGNPIYLDPERCQSGESDVILFFDEEIIEGEAYQHKLALDYYLGPEQNEGDEQYEEAETEEMTTEKSYVETESVQQEMDIEYDYGIGQ